MKNGFFRKLGPIEAAEFRAWARKSYVIDTPIDDAWHPVARAEAALMNAETTLSETETRVMEDESETEGDV